MRRQLFSFTILLFIFAPLTEAKEPKQIVLHQAVRGSGGGQDGERLVYSVDPERWLQMPIWNPDTDGEPPLSFKRAYEIAGRWYKSRRGEQPLYSYTASCRSGRWCYKFDFVPPKNSPNWDNTVVVLMDGTIVEPSRTRVIDTQPENQSR